MSVPPALLESDSLQQLGFLTPTTVTKPRRNLAAEALRASGLVTGDQGTAVPPEGVGAPRPSPTPLPRRFFLLAGPGSRPS